MSCLMCEHFKPIRTADWKPSYSGKEYDRYDVRNLIMQTKLHQKGQCALNPVHVDVMTNHYCGQFIAETRYPPSPSERLSDFIWGDRVSRRVDTLEDENTTLKRQLKTARMRSLKRLRKLQSARGRVNKQAKAEATTET